MINIIKHITYFICDSCNKKEKRITLPEDYLGYYKLPNNWSSYKIFSSYTHYCDDIKCQNVLNSIDKE